MTSPSKNIAICISVARKRYYKNNFMPKLKNTNTE